MTGTRVRYWADRQIFIKDAGLQLRRAGRSGPGRRRSSCPGLTLVIRDERGLPGHAGSRRPARGDLLPPRRHRRVRRLPRAGRGRHRRLAAGRARALPETVPVLDEQGHMTPTEVERECAVDIALRWGTGYDTRSARSSTSSRRPRAAPTSPASSRRCSRRSRKQVELNARRLKVGGKDNRLDKDDILAGLTGVVTVRLAEPQFEGQTKEVLGTPAVRGIVAKVVEQRADRALLTSTKRGDKQQAALLLEKVVAEMKSRISARQHKETQRRKNALESLLAAGQARRLPHRRRRAQRAVHRRGRQRARHGQAGPQLGVPGAAADPRQDPQRAEGVGRRHARATPSAPRSSR